MAHDESRETPEMEAKAHGRGFLKKAARMAGKKKSGKGKGKRKVARGM